MKIYYSLLKRYYPFTSYIVNGIINRLRIDKVMVLTFKNRRYCSIYQALYDPTIIDYEFVDLEVGVGKKNKRTFPHLVQI